MSERQTAERSQATTMVCQSCDVTWRGNPDDECWSCSESERVIAAAPAKVRHGAPTIERHRLVG